MPLLMPLLHRFSGTPTLHGWSTCRTSRTLHSRSQILNLAMMRTHFWEVNLNSACQFVRCAGLYRARTTSTQPWNKPGARAHSRRSRTQLPHPAAAPSSRTQQPHPAAAPNCRRLHLSTQLRAAPGRVFVHCTLQTAARCVRLRNQELQQRRRGQGRPERRPGGAAAAVQDLPRAFWEFVAVF